MNSVASQNTLTWMFALCLTAMLSGCDKSSTTEKPAESEKTSTTTAGDKQTAAKKSKPLDLPPILAKDRKTVEYLNTLNQVMDEYALFAEKMAPMQKKQEQTGKDIGIADAFKAMGSINDWAQKVGPLMERLSDLMGQSGNILEKMTPEQAEAFGKVYEQLIERQRTLTSPVGNSKPSP